MDNDLLASAKMCIVGLGLMGGSLAMALKDKCGKLYGVDIDEDVLAYVEKHTLVDMASDRLEALVPEANVLVLAVPVESIKRIIQQLPDIHPGMAIVMDIGSTKREIMAEFESLPARFDPIGGHPICGKENLSIKNAEADLFQGGPFAFTPLERTTEKARLFAAQLAAALGAKPLWIGAEEHDAWVAATSHLPFLISMALAHSTPNEVSPLIGPGFRSTVRLAGTPANMMVDILRSNRDEILKAGTVYRSQFDEILTLLEGSDFERLSEMIEAGRVRKHELVGQNGN